MLSISFLAAAAMLPAPLTSADFDPRPVIIGGSTANLLYGKLQRAAQLPTTRLAKNPCAAVNDRGKLESLLWSSFAMSNLPASDALRREDLGGTRDLSSGLLFVDNLASEKGGGGLFGGLPFGKKNAAAEGAAPPLDRSALELASSRGALHAFVLLQDDAAVQECVDLLAGLPLCATIIAPEAGTSVASTPGWVCPTLQDHDGALLAPLAVRNGWDPVSPDSHTSAASAGLVWHPAHLSARPLVPSIGGEHAAAGARGRLDGGARS